MPSTYTLNNGIELISTGEQSGTWGDTTNTNLSLLDTALDGQVTVTLPSAGTSGSPNTLAITDGAASDGRNRMVTFADGGDLGATAFVQLTPNDSEKIIYVRNTLAGSRSIILFQGTYNASNDYEVPAGTTAVVYFDGAGSGAVAANVFNNAHFDALNVVGSVTVGGGVTVTGTVDAGTVEFDNLSGTGAVSVTNILDEDNMASDSATALSTQQSIKAYVDAQVGTVDTLAEILANGNTTGGNDIVFSAGDKITNASGDLTLDVAGDIVLDAAGTQVILKKAGTQFGEFLTSSTPDNLYIKSSIQDKDIIFGGNDGGSAITALTLDMSAAGRAIFNADANMTDGNAFRFGDNQDFLIYHSSNQNIIQANTTDQDIIFKGVDNGSSITALTLDMSEAGAATFNSSITIPDYIYHTSDANTYFGFPGGDEFELVTAAQSRIKLVGSETVFNEGSNDKDFRVESDTNTHALFVDAGNNQVVVGTSSPITGVGAVMTVGGGTDTRLAIDGSSSSGLYLSDSGAQGITIRNASGDLEFYGVASGEFVFNGGSLDTDFRVASLTNTHMLFVNAGINRVGIGESGPLARLHLKMGGSSRTDGFYITRSDNDNHQLGLWTSGGTMYFDAFTDNASSSGQFRLRHSRDAGSTTTESILASDTNVVINDGSANMDFRVESDSNSNIFFVDAGFDSGQGAIGIGTGSPQRASGFGGSQSVLQITGCTVPELRLTSSTSGQGDLSIYASNSGSGAYLNNLNGNILIGRGGNNIITVGNGVIINEDGDDVDFRVESDNNANCFKVDAGGDAGQGVVLFAQSVAASSVNGAYFSLGTDNAHLVVANTQVTNALAVCYLNRQGSDGTLMEFRKGDNSKGSISVSGATVSFNGFSGRHESSGIPTNTPVGTVVSTIDELDVYPNTSRDTKGNIITNPQAGQTRADHAKVEVSTSVGDTCVYGVVSEFDNNGKLIVTSVGIGSVRVTGACAKGDLLESNGDGTAKVQSDDIVRSKTLGKVTIGNSDTGVKLVSCVMYCG